MTPLSEQDPALWRRPLIEEADDYLERASTLDRGDPRGLQAAIHGAWCRRTSLTQPPPWRGVLSLYDLLLAQRDDPVVRLNRAVALAEIAGVEAGLSAVDALDGEALAGYLPYHAVRADLLRRAGRAAESGAAYDAALALGPAPAERMWLERQKQSVPSR
jgi:RNA polymerase sigma-70 factor, ECF subfamily